MAQTLVASQPIRSIFDVVASRLAAVVAWRKERAIYWQTVRELQSLSNRELADLGISRSGIHAVAREHVYGA